MKCKKYLEMLGISKCGYCCEKCSKCHKSINCEEKKKLEGLLNLAIEQRKFSIELYWKRANYFWLFVAAIFVAYIRTLPKKDTPNYTEMEWVNLIVCLVGVICSIGWYMTNRGSKYWQENWEAHIKCISKKLDCSIFETYMNPQKTFKDVLSYYPYSFTKVNLILNMVFVLTWFLLLVFRSSSLLGIKLCCCCSTCNWILILLGLAFIVIVFAALMHRCSQSFVKKKQKESRSENEEDIYNQFIQFF